MATMLPARARQVRTSPTGNIAATDVQAALAELDNGKRLWSPTDVLSYPAFGVRKCFPRDLRHTDAGNLDPYLFYQGHGKAGCVRRIWFLFLLDNTFVLHLQNYRIRIYADCGDVADFANPGTPTADIPLDLLFGGRYRLLDLAANGPIDQENMGPISCHFDGDPVLNNGVSVVWELPIPYSDGCLVQLWYDDLGGGGFAAQLPTYSMAEYDDGDLPASPYEAWRLRSAETSGALAYEATRTLMDVESGSGLVCGFFAACDGATGPEYAENNVIFRLNGDEGNTWESSSLEDIFNNPYYWSRGFRIGPRFGTFYAEMTSEYQFQSYRWLEIPFESGCVGLWTNNYPTYTTAVEAEFLVLYYSDN